MGMGGGSSVNQLMGNFYPFSAPQYHGYNQLGITPNFTQNYGSFHSREMTNHAGFTHDLADSNSQVENNTNHLITRVDRLKNPKKYFSYFGFYNFQISTKICVSYFENTFH